MGSDDEIIIRNGTFAKMWKWLRYYEVIIVPFKMRAAYLLLLSHRTHPRSH